MITGINEWKSLTKHLSCECKCKFDEKNVIQINGGIIINADVSVKSTIYVKKIIFGILLQVVVKIFNKYYGWFSDNVWWNYRCGS